MTTIEPGWYVDYQNPKQMRYHDGSAWTDHVHVDRKNLPAAPVPTRAVPPMPPAATAHAAPVANAEVSSKYSSTDLMSMVVVGIFVGLIFGGALFNGLGAITPVTEYPGTVDRIEIEFSSTGSGVSRRSHVLSGSADGWVDWRIVNEDAYRLLDEQGYPQDVIVAVGHWTGSPERITGTSFLVDHQTTGARVVWAAAIGLVGLAAIFAGILIGRVKPKGLLGAVVFLASFFGPGSWLGYQLFQFFQSA